MRSKLHCKQRIVVNLFLPLCPTRRLDVMMSVQFHASQSQTASIVCLDAASVSDAQDPFVVLHLSMPAFLEKRNLKSKQALRPKRTPSQAWVNFAWKQRMDEVLLLFRKGEV